MLVHIAMLRSTCYTIITLFDIHVQVQLKFEHSYIAQ